MALVMLGHRDVRLYDGSLLEWAADPALPMESDPVPTSSDQALINIENTGLVAELRKALQWQTATSEILDIIIRSPGTLNPVLDAILERVIAFADAAYCILWSFDGTRFRSAASRGLPEQVSEAACPEPTTGLHARLLRGDPLVHIADVSAKELDQVDEDLLPSGFGERGCARTMLMVPLLKGDEVVGALSAYRQRVQLFTDNQINLVQHLASQAVIAMENARLLGELRQRTEEIATWNRELEARVAAQVEELGRVGRLKRFLSPQLAEMIVSQGDEKILESHRRDIVVVFCDLRGYTAFTETAEPEEVLDFLREYHGALGPLVSKFEGTLDQFSGDGIMVLFNDPVPSTSPLSRRVANLFPHIECRDWPAEAFEIKIPERFELRDGADGVGHPGADQYLPVLRLGTKSGGEVAHRANCSVAGPI
jgi:adenylate cyclase